MVLIFHFKCTLKCRLQFVLIWTTLKFCRLVMRYEEINRQMYMKKKNNIKRKNLLRPYTAVCDSEFYFAESIDQDQPAHTCNLILLSTLRCSMILSMRSNQVRCICVMINNRNSVEKGILRNFASDVNSTVLLLVKERNVYLDANVRNLYQIWRLRCLNLAFRRYVQYFRSCFENNTHFL